MDKSTNKDKIHLGSEIHFDFGRMPAGQLPLMPRRPPPHMPRILPLEPDTLKAINCRQALMRCTVLPFNHLRPLVLHFSTIQEAWPLRMVRLIAKVLFWMLRE